MWYLKQLIAILLLLAVFVSGLWFIGRQQKAETGKPTAQKTTDSQPTPKAFNPTAEQWANLVRQNVVMHAFRAGLVTDGKIAIDEDRTTPVFSPYSGMVRRLVAKPGDPIEAGQLLFTIEATDMVQAQNDFIVAADGVNITRSQLEMAQTTEKRQQALYSAKATALKDWQQAQTDLATAENTKRSAEVALEAARNRLRILKKTETEIAEFQNSGQINPETPIYSPISGTVVQRKVGPGQYITSGASDPTGDPVFIIGDLTTVWLVANVRETDALEIRRGQTIEFKALSARDRIFTAHINYVAEILDPGTRRLQVRATVENADRSLKPEMFARATVYLGEAQTSPAVPREAIIYEGDTARVWVVSGETSLELRTITPGLVSGNLVQVLSGLNAQDNVLTRGTLFIDRAANGSEAD